MKPQDTDVVIVGAGPVGLMCAYLGNLCGLSTIVVDKSAGPLEVGRADALNARTLQLLEIGGLFDELYPLGKPCNTSSVWAEGKFVSRQSSWWDDLPGCFHKHFLMLGQSYVEKLLDQKLRAKGPIVRRSTMVEDVRVSPEGCETTLAGGEKIRSKYVIGADGSRSLVREKFKVPFQIVRPELVWAVIDGIVETDFPKVPEIIAFQADTADVAWIPREGEIDRFYVRMDTKEFALEDALAKINRAMRPHTLRFKGITWFSQFSVKESVAEKFFVHDRVFLAGDAAHIHSVNGGQGLNTGLADAFNLMWKLNQVINHGKNPELLQSYEDERQPVARSVVETSGELVRSTKYSETGTQALDYVNIVQKRAGNITGMGIRYGKEGPVGQRVPDFKVQVGASETRLYSILDYASYTLLVFSEADTGLQLPPFIKKLHLGPGQQRSAAPGLLHHEAVLVRPDGYIEETGTLELIRLKIAQM